MPKNEDGEFELILGNRQLLSVFFIVVVLLGVFFTMGYIVGRSSAPVTSADVARKPETKPLVVDSAAPPASSPSTQAPKVAEPPASQPVSTAQQKPPEPVQKSEPKPEPVKAEKRSAAVATEQPVSGQTYLQLTAIAKDDADVYVNVLRKNGFTAFASEVPEKPGLFRILVGPIKDGDMNKTRADLQSKSFPGNLAIKRTF